MTPNEKPQFLAILVGLAAIKPGKGLTTEALEIWWNAMQEWDISDFRAAASHLSRSVEFMPSPYHFDQLRKASLPTAAEAWTTVLRGDSLEPGSLLHRVAESVGGQKHIRMANIERDLPHIQRRFVESYEALSDAEEIRIKLPKIAKGNWLEGVRKAIEAPTKTNVPAN